MTEQEILPGIKVQNHANLGRIFENEIETVNQWYRLTCQADIRQIPRNWQIISFYEYRKLQAKLPPSMLAKTDNNRFLQRVKSDVDFLGGGKFAGISFAIAFDTKETSLPRFPLSNLEPHQFFKLRDRHRCGFISGLMIKFTAENRVFFADFAYLNEKKLQMESEKIGRRAKNGTASLSIKDLAENGHEIFLHKQNKVWDYLSVLVSEKKDKI